MIPFEAAWCCQCVSELEKALAKPVAPYAVNPFPNSLFSNELCDLLDNRRMADVSQSSAETRAVGQLVALVITPVILQSGNNAAICCKSIFHWVLRKGLTA